MALLASLVAALLLTGLGMSLVLLGSAGTTLAAHDRVVLDAEYAAEAALRLAVSELRERTDWTLLVLPGATADMCADPGRFADASLLPPAPWDGSTIDLHALTQQIQASADAAAPPGVTAPVWRLFEYGPISQLIPSDPGRHPFYVAVWAADGRSGLVLLHAVALGPGAAKAAVAATLGRDGSGAAVRLTLRSAR